MSTVRLVRSMEWLERHRNVVAWVGFVCLGTVGMLILRHHDVPSPDRIIAFTLATTAGAWMAYVHD
jgi:hypothetical protein